MILEKWEKTLNRWLSYEDLDPDMLAELRALVKKKDKKTKRMLEESFYKQLEFGTSGLRAPLGIGPNCMNTYTVRKITQGICDYIIEDLGAFDGIGATGTGSGTGTDCGGRKMPSVAIGYDSRINSRRFAECAAEVLAANGIKAYMYDEITPTAALSYAVRKFGCLVGVMITASHNPSIYNGYKVYNATGGQVMPAEQKKMFAHISSLDIFADVSYLNFELAKNTPYFETISDDVIEEYIDCVMAEQLYGADGCDICRNSLSKASVQGVDADNTENEAYNPGSVNHVAESTVAMREAEPTNEAEALRALKVIYTPLNGGGNRPVRAMMKRLGIENVEIVRSQEKPDGNFPTCPYPNPERDEAFEEALKLAKNSRADIIIATDPDSDRLGVMVKTRNGQYRRFSGNEVGILMLDYIIRRRKAAGTNSGCMEDAEEQVNSKETICGQFTVMSGVGSPKGLPKHAVAMRSIASTTLADIIARENGVEMRVIPNGSCYIGDVLDELEKAGRIDDFIFAFEESIEYLTGNYSHDEDGVLGAMHILCAAAEAKAAGTTLDEVLEDIYKKYGYFESVSVNLEFPGIEGKDKIADAMLGLGYDVESVNKYLAKNDPEDQSRMELFGRKVVKAVNYLNGDPDNPGFPKLNMIEFKLEGDAGFIVRPSGTEPKLKIYIHAKGKSSEEAKTIASEIANNLEAAIIESISARTYENAPDVIGIIDSPGEETEEA